MSNRYFRLAKETAVKGSKMRKHKLGAVGIRRDGAIVKSSNLPNRLPEKNAHAEARVVKKLGYGGVIYVARVLNNGSFALARPCRGCQGIMRYNGVKRCYYTINDKESGVIEL